MQHKASCMVQPGLIIKNSALREVDLEPSAKRGTNRTGALLSLYWLSWSLLLKQSFNKISYKSILIDPVKLSWTWDETDQISKLHALQHIKTNSPKRTNSINAHDYGYKWAQAKLNPLANQNVRSITKSVISF